jgi:lipid II:glycine glycyltransferase (peptidoglycan interpeptide bridge formation enzyme)
MANTYKLLKEERLTFDTNLLNIGKPVLIYNIDSNMPVAYYSSLNQAMKNLNLKWETLTRGITQNIIIKDNLIASYKPLTLEEIKKRDRVLYTIGRYR